MSKRLEYEQFLFEQYEIDIDENKDLQRTLDIIRKDEDFSFEIRKGNPIIYCLGCKCIEINKRVNNKLVFSINPEYSRECKRKNKFETYKYNEDDKMMLSNLMKNQDNYKLWNENLMNIKQCMLRYRKNVVKNEERKKQHLLSTYNNNFARDVVVVDIEYGIRELKNSDSKLCKFDMVALVKNNNMYDICLIELKVGGGAIEGVAGVIQHIKDLNSIIKNRSEDIKKSCINIVKIKNKYSFIKGLNTDILESQLSGNIYACILGYAENDFKIEQEKYNSKIENVKASDLNCDVYYNFLPNIADNELTVEILKQNKIM